MIRKWHIGKRRWFTLPRIIAGGIAVFILTIYVAGRVEFSNTVNLAESALDTLKSRCSSYERLMAADRTKSLFRLTDMMRDFSNQMEEMEEPVTDEYLEQYVDRMRLSGIAILDENLILQASGYTRQFRNAEWMYTSNGAQFSDILIHPQKVFAERIEENGKYYDICAVARKDAPGIMIGFYQQPTGMITNTESDLESLLTGLKLERRGNYIITENDIVRASSEAEIKDETLSDNNVLRQLTWIEKDNHLHLFRSGTNYYWGYRDGYEGYKLFIYYPFFAPFSSSLMSGLFAMAIYAVLFLLLISVRNRTLFENQTNLEKSNHELTETVKMLKALETIYFALFRVNLIDDSYHTISVSRYLEDKIPQGGNYTELRKLFLQKMTKSSYCDEINSKMSSEAIRKTLNRENMTDVRKSFYMDFEATKEGQTKWCRITATVVDFDEAGKPVHALVLLQDINKEKIKEAEYQAKILDESQKARVANNAKTDFLRRISHDIRTPLNGIRGYIDMGNSDPGNKTLQKYCREKAMIALDTLYELVNSVLEMSDMEGHEVQVEEVPFDLEILLKEVDTVIKPQAIAKNINCRILQEDSIPINHLIGSPRHVTQILMNLASNGVKFGKQNGFFCLDIRVISQSKDAITYEFYFEDDGIGMSEEFQKHIYEPFVQEKTSARSSYEGTGLGLAIVKKLVDALGGTIIFHSKKNAGTKFWVQLTFQIDKMLDEPIKTNGSKNSLCLQDIHILLVEDNELNMEIAEFFLENHGAKITKAWDGREAVDIFIVSEPGDYDLILTDVMMPVMDGLEACRVIRALDRQDAKSIPIAAMSANVLESDTQRSREAGMNGHIGKPIDEKKLLEMIFQILNERKENIKSLVKNSRNSR